MVCRLLPDTRPIRFYERGQPYFEFTNFAEYPIQLHGITWPTSEHYFQAQKFVGTPYEEQVRNLPSARDAFEFSRRPEVSQWLRSDWEKVKLDVMYKALLAKFSQHGTLRDMLVKTGNRQLIEHTSRDSYWGDGGDGHGQNNLGQLLMKVRSELSSSKSDNVVGKGISGATNIFSAFVSVKTFLLAAAHGRIRRIGAVCWPRVVHAFTTGVASWWLLYRRNLNKININFEWRHDCVPRMDLQRHTVNSRCKTMM